MTLKNLTRNKGLFILLAIALVFIPLFVIEYAVLKRTDGKFMYPLDDTFIHMAVARNLAVFNNWGINSAEFGSASSSVLYTVILTLAFKIFPVNMLVPFIINCIAAVFLVFAIMKWLRKEQVAPWAQLAVMLCIIFFTPLPIIIMSGMEHTLQCLFSFLFVFGFAAWLEKMVSFNSVKWEMPWSVIFYGTMVASIRYEGLFLVAMVCLVLFFHKRFSLAFRLGCIAVLPLVIFGIYSVGKGSYFLPNSVLIKSEGVTLTPGGIVSFINNILVQKLTIPKTVITSLATHRLLVILPLAYLAFLKFVKIRPAFGYILVIITGCTMMHLSFASTGWFYRYEAYLVLSSVLVISVLIYKYGNEVITANFRYARFISLVLLFALVFPFVLRSTAAYTKASQACVNIYEQQYQMGLFLKKYYENEVIAANDIGAISYFTKGDNVDLWGLGTIEVARSKKMNYWTPDFLDSLSLQKKARIAVVYDSWFNNELLHRWKKVATWQVENNVILGDNIVSFYAIDPGIEPELRHHLQEFQKSLPVTVQVLYY
jgi:hypothetical protein